MLKFSNKLNNKIVPIPIQAYATTKKGIPYAFVFIAVSANKLLTISNNIISLRIITVFYRGLVNWGSALISSVTFSTFSSATWISIPLETIFKPP